VASENVLSIKELANCKM